MRHPSCSSDRGLAACPVPRLPPAGNGSPGRLRQVGCELGRAPSSLSEPLRGHPSFPSPGQRRERRGSAAEEAEKGPCLLGGDGTPSKGRAGAARELPPSLPGFQGSVALRAEVRGCVTHRRERDLRPRPVLGVGMPKSKSMALGDEAVLV